MKTEAKKLNTIKAKVAAGDRDLNDIKLIRADIESKVAATRPVEITKEEVKELNKLYKKQNKLFKNVKTRTVMISPKKAMELLYGNYDNRNLNDRHVEMLTKAIKTGHWMLNGESIIIDNEGRLLDGQHRLYAVIKSGVTVPMLIVEGIDVKSFITLNNLIKIRRGEDVLSSGSDGAPNAAKANALIKHVINWHNRSSHMNHAANRKGSFNQTNDVIYSIYQQIGDNVQQSIEDVKRIIKQNGKYNAIYITTALFLLRQNEDSAQVDDFVNYIVEGGDYRQSPATRLIPTIKRRKENMPHGRYRCETIFMVLKSYELWTNGETMPEKMSTKPYIEKMMKSHEDFYNKYDTNIDWTKV